MRKQVVVIIILVCMYGFAVSCGHSAESSRLYAGTAKVDYTPDSVPDSLILDHQFIRVIAFSDGERKALLIATELKWIHNSIWEDISKRISGETGIAPEYILLSAVHTHCGVRQGADFTDTVLLCVKEALANLQPVRIGFGKGECKMNINRRMRYVDGSIIIGRNPYGPCDHEVGVLRIDDEQGNALSLMINWPCHAVINFPQPKLFSADWPGSAAKFLESKFQNNVCVPVTIGASGDINPLYWTQPYPPLDAEDMVNMPNWTRPNPEIEGSSVQKEGLALTAMYLGEEAMRVSKEIVTSPYGTISAVQRYVRLPGIQRLTSWEPNQEIIQGDDFEVRLTALKVGNVVFSGFGGEVMTEIGMDLKEQSPYKNTFVITHCNGSVGYLVTDNTYKEGGLEPARTRGMPGTAKALIDTMLEMINEL